MKNIIDQTPEEYASAKLEAFVNTPHVLFSDKGMRPISIEDRLLSYRSARDQREPTQEELKLRVKLAYLNEYEEHLKQHIEYYKNKAWNLK